MKLLLLHRADPNVSDIAGWRPVMMAAYNGHIECVQLLAEQGANLIAREQSTGFTAVNLAASAGRAECVELLAMYRADVGQEEHGGFTPAMFAAQQGRADLLDMLSEEYKVDLNRRALATGYTATMLAAVSGSADCLRVLARHGANIDEAALDGDTALILAAARGYTECVHVLAREFLATVGTRDGVGATALAAAVLGGHWKTAALLVDAGGKDLLLVRDDAGRTCLGRAMEMGEVDKCTRLARRLGPAAEDVLLQAAAEARTAQAAAARRGLEQSAAEAGKMEPFRGAEGAVRVRDGLVGFRGSLGSARARAFCPRRARAYFELEVVRAGTGFAAGFCSERSAPSS